ncbi:unnamed protein product [Somion occarium]|uniref:Pheromone receptor n=1 Tax=Somion occarium TaxID=3059160 RepID=A0ABP1CS05_9APHY
MENCIKHVRLRTFSKIVAYPSALPDSALLYYILFGSDHAPLVYKIAKHWMHLVHLLGRLAMPRAFYQRHNLERQYCVPCSNLVRDLFEFASSMGVVCAGLVIARRISNVVTVTTATLPKEDRRRQMYTDLAIGLVPPSTQLIAFYFIQGHRYNIFEGLGCSLATPSSILYISLTSIWGVIIGLISAFYCCRTLYALYKRHRQIKQVLLASNVDMQHFYRLIAMAVIEMCSTVPLCLWSLVTCVESYYPWNGFADLHLDFDRIERYPALLWITIGEYSTLEDQWFSVGCGLIFFGIFGFTQEARNKYRQLLGLPATKIPAPIFTPEGSQPQQGRVLTVWPYWWKMRRTEDHARTTLEFHIETSQTRLSSQTVAQQTNTDSIV